ncbi:MAG: rhomboid family intramembrane serine protease [Micrococcaceae bacterium]|uniref:rhomboid family intramembrane serine protease n=2 Tax=Arthrobacter TaxID=1663 RepID=UPI00264E4546|nr:rhomboid family intramembrane serine protease [Micrococcaceae bacterium]MDN5878635.1 rhomboid family intramembrane serine protease [Micrococcaceae bacterium]MDN5886119.1 rhomboid family intramembrane serine protease [Micrococcaceae bacterium]MDN5905455.1 rhomboid family intramembrane serine protease [Micrococcaceae bacterium]MDN6170170.1 rhomboid family intramembrane serine protease [Micrococcaceae bacterium]
MAFGQPEQEPQTPVPTCPRHPDRPSYVRCQRCGRPACPECQRTAAVGVQCVECVAQANSERRRPQTVTGGRLTSGRPTVTYAVIALCVVLFGGQYLIPGLTDRLLYAGLYTGSEPWRMITSLFLHSTGLIMHIAFNMYALYILGRVLEPALGHVRFAVLYLVAGFGGSVGVLLLAAPNVAVVGASGAVFGLFGAFMVVTKAHGGNLVPVLVIIGINLVIGFLPGANIAWQAHVGGLVTGGAVAAVLVFSPRGRNRALLQWSGIGIIVVALGVLTWLGWAPIRALYQPIMG